jgi:hypothetical protein
MTKILQYNDFACFTACLESFLIDNKRQFDHQKFIQANLDLFNGGEHIEGACNSENFPEVAKRIGLGFEQISKFTGIKFSPDRETILFGALWHGKESDKHVVRYFAKDNGRLRVMNPRIGDFDDLDPSWIIGIYKFSLT